MTEVEFGHSLMRLISVVEVKIDNCMHTDGCISDIRAYHSIQSVSVNNCVIVDQIL